MRHFELTKALFIGKRALSQERKCASKFGRPQNSAGTCPDGNCTYADHTPITAALERARKVPGKRYPLVVVFVGDSFLRQVVEAMACRSAWVWGSGYV